MTAPHEAIQPSRATKTNKNQNARRARLDVANELLHVIASHGRRFFHFGGVSVYNKDAQSSEFVPADRYARFEVDPRGRLWFIDDYSQRRIYMHKTGFCGRWKGFSHGGTLRALVTDMARYILKGEPISPFKIGLQRLGADDFIDNIWGYSEQAILAVREAALKLPIMGASASTPPALPTPIMA